MMKRLLLTLLCGPLLAGGLPKDKVGHFAGGFAIGATVNLTVRWSGGSRAQGARIGFAVGTAAGLQKEWLDRYSNQTAQAQGLRPVHSVEAWDAIATVAGAACGSYAVSWVTK